MLGVAVYLIAFLFLLGLLPAFLARQKGHSFLVWWLYGAVLFVIALPHVMVLRPRNVAEMADGKSCPYCEELVPQEDEICPFCHLHLYDPALDGPAMGHSMTHRHA